MTNQDQRVIGFVLHTDPTALSDDGPDRYMLDWGLIELYRGKIDWDMFKGKQGLCRYVSHLVPQFRYLADYPAGDNLDFGELMFPHPSDRADYQVPVDDVL